MFLSSLETMGLTVQPEGKVLKIIESNRARESAIPTYGGDNNPPTQDQFVTRLSAPRARQPRRSEGRARPPEEPRRRHHQLRADQHARHHRPGVEHPAHGRRRPPARRADGRREDLGHQAAHRRRRPTWPSMLSTIFSVAKARRAPPARAAGGADRSCRRAAGGGRRGRARTRTAGRGPVGLADHPRRSAEHARHRLDGECLSAHPGAGQAARPEVGATRRQRRPTSCTSCALGERQRRRRRRHARRPRRRREPRLVVGGSSSTPRAAADSGAVAGGSAAAARPACSKATCASRPTSRPTRSSSWRRGATTSRCASSSRSSTCRATRCSSRRRSSRSPSTRRASSASPGTAARRWARAATSRCSSAARSRRRTSTRMLFSPAALSGLAAGLRGPPIPGADTILGLPPGTSVPSFGVFVQALQNNGDVNVVSMPHILTTDNEKATIQVGQNLPFPGSLGGFPTAAPPAPAARRCRARPSASARRCSARTSRSSWRSRRTSTTPTSCASRSTTSCPTSSNPNFNGLGPATSKRTVKSVVTIRDQQTIVLGGLIKDPCQKR